MTIEFWTTSIVVTATPGTGVLFTIAAGLTRGARAGLVAAVGAPWGSSRTWWRPSPARPPF